MNISRVNMNPLARKRWSRFRRHRRGYWSLVLLVALYVLSLFAEFICNDRPLLVRYSGKSYFPVFRFYPDDAFTGSGRLTRPDYKAIRDSDNFKANSANRMIFPPVPYGPFEIIKTESLKGEERVEIKLRASPRVGNVNLDPSFHVVRSQSADYFLPGDSTAPMTSVWNFPDSFRESIGRRFSNQASAADRIILTNTMDRDKVTEISVNEFTPRRENPRDVRITFREVSDRSSLVHAFTFDAELKIVHSSELWEKMNADQRSTLIEYARNAFSGNTSVSPMILDDLEYKIQALRKDVQWPFRPVASHLLGIDSAGRDVFARILYGLRTSMTFGLLLVVFSMVFGIIMGAVQGFYGGRVDLIAQRLIEIWSTIPFLYVMILLGSMYGRSFGLLLFCYAIFHWIGISYYVRAEFLRLRNMPFVDAARCLGISSTQIMSRHILPNALTPIITLFPFLLVGAIGSLAVLDFLGFGLPQPTPSWGEMLLQAQNFRWAWWLIVYPTLALITVILLGVFMGEAVRDAYDPKPLMKME